MRDCSFGGPSYPANSWIWNNCVKKFFSHNRPIPPFTTKIAGNRKNFETFVAVKLVFLKVKKKFI